MQFAAAVTGWNIRLEGSTGRGTLRKSGGVAGRSSQPISSPLSRPLSAAYLKLRLQPASRRWGLDQWRKVYRGSVGRQGAIACRHVCYAPQKPKAKKSPFETITKRNGTQLVATRRDGIAKSCVTAG